MTEEIITAMRILQHLLRSQWAILSNLFEARWNSFQSQGSSHIHPTNNRPVDGSQLTFLRNQAELDRLIALAMRVFGKPWYEIEEYREVSSDAFRIFTDDLDRAVKTSDTLKSSYTDRYVNELESKLEEIAEKIDSHLKVKRETR